MDDLEAKLSSLLQDPQMLQQLSELASSLQLPQQPPENGNAALGGLDPQMLMRLSGLMGQAGIDANQKSLLSALTPYLTAQRIGKLEKAMQAAKMAKLASGLLGQNGLIGR
ncbi:MAG: hypothetical protein E7437_03030 [Ruminococcaceae bacterium]|nr:hypothetical protein [Oscillospiraceae bacterium]